MRKAYIIGILLGAVLLVLGGCAPASAPPKEVELKHDDGESDGNCSSGLYGFLVHFSSPATPFTISKVRVFK